MAKQRVILCGETPGGIKAGSLKPVELRLWGSDANVELKISDITEKMLSNLPDRVIDLLEIATYVYCADQATTRGGPGDQGVGARWRRNFDFHIPVREPEIWSEKRVLSSLSQTLGFLSEDEYRFTFSKLDNPPPVSQYFEFEIDNRSGFHADEVILFSGGLDSLSGAIQETLIEDKHTALVSHRSSPKISKRQKELIAQLKMHSKVAPFHIPVWIHKQGVLTREYTQRTRSFLFACLGAVIARSFELDRIRFYENGTISINLPISEQVIGARATRTTHPQVLNGFSDLFSALFEIDFMVENPFQWMTKTEVVQKILQTDYSNLIKDSVSCTHTWTTTAAKTHCGVCSQCIDRRMATLGAGCTNDDDPKEAYNIDLLTGERKDGPDRTMLESYFRTAREINRLSDDAFLAKFPESMRVIGHVRDLSIDQTASKIIDLYKRHSKQVCDAITEGIRNHAAEISEGNLPSNCLLAIALPDKEIKPGKAITLLDKIPKDDCIFQKRANNYLVGYDSRVASLPCLKGMYYIAYLLGAPGYETPVMQLLAAVAGEDSIVGGSAGEVIDKKALAQYRERLEDIKKDLKKAEENNDLERKSALQEEKEIIESEIIQASGLGNRIRRVSDGPERARKSISMAIDRAVKKIKAEHPSLGDHLGNSIKKGMLFSYSPETPLSWIT